MHKMNIMRITDEILTLKITEIVYKNMEFYKKKPTHKNKISTAVVCICSLHLCHEQGRRNEFFSSEAQQNFPFF